MILTQELHFWKLGKTKEGVRWKHDNMSVIISVLHQYCVTLLQEPDPTRVAGVGLACVAGGVGHSSAHQPRRIVYKNLKKH